MTDPIILERDDLTVTHHGKTRAFAAASPKAHEIRKAREQ